MTRFARGEKSNKKKEHEASSWKDLKSTQSSHKHQASATRKRTYDERITKKHNKSALKFRLQEKTSLEYLSNTTEDDLIPFQPPPDEEQRPGLATLLEDIVVKPQPVGINSSQSDTSPRKGLSKKSKKNKKSGEKLIKTDTINELLHLRDSVKSNDEEKLDEVDAAIKKEQRREQRRLKRVNERADSKMCFNCRQSGHTMEECPVKKDSESGHGICYKCGSTEHAVQICKVRLPPGQFPYAKCFICGQQGHLSKMCPDNPKGLYPNGGCCRECGSVEHYKRDCPELQKKQSGYVEVKATIFTGGSVDDDSFSLVIDDTPQVKVTKKKPKIVKF